MIRVPKHYGRKEKNESFPQGCHFQTFPMEGVISVSAARTRSFARAITVQKQMTSQEMACSSAYKSICHLAYHVASSWQKQWKLFQKTACSVVLLIIGVLSQAQTILSWVAKQLFPGSTTVSFLWILFAVVLFCFHTPICHIYLIQKWKPQFKKPAQFYEEIM